MLYLLSEDDVVLYKLFGQKHGVLDMDVVVGSAVQHH